MPLVISTTLKASQIAIIVEKNPTALSGIFYFPEGAEPLVVEGQRMIAGETVLHDMNNQESARRGIKR